MCVLSLLACRCSSSSIWLYEWAQLSVMLIRTSDSLITPPACSPHRSFSHHCTHSWMTETARGNKKPELGWERGDKSRWEENLTELYGSEKKREREQGAKWNVKTMKRIRDTCIKVIVHLRQYEESVNALTQINWMNIL